MRPTMKVVSSERRPVLRIAATLGRDSGTNADGGNDGTSLYQLTRTVHRTGQYPVFAPRLLVGNVKILGTTPYGEATVGNSITYRCALEINGLSYECLWAGVQGKSVAALSKDITDSLQQGIPADTTFYARTMLQVGATANKWPRAQTITQNSQRAKKGATVLEIGSVGALVGGSSDAPHPPLGILGMVDSRQLAVVYGLTSVADGTTDDPIIDANGAVGFIGRGLASVLGHAIPYIKMSRGGEVYSALADPTTGALRRSLFQYATDVILDGPTNDMIASLGHTAADIKGYMLTVWAAARAAGCRVWQANILPRVTPTPDMTTLGNQAIYPNFEANGTSHRDVLNAWFPTQVTAGLIDGVVDIASLFEDQGTRGKWAIGPLTSGDGTHPLPAGHTAAAALITTLASTWAAR